MIHNDLYSFSDLLRIFPFGKTKLRQLLNAGVLPVAEKWFHIFQISIHHLF